MARQTPFTEYEAVLLLDAYLRTVSGDASRRDAVKDCSDALRRIAINKGMEIEDAYRNTGGISFQMASMESAYRGETITKPATKLFTETVSMYRNDRKKYEGLLKEAKLMADGKHNGEAAFMSWLSKKVSPTQLSELHMVFQEIEQQAKKAKIVKKSLYENADIAVFKKICSNIEQSKVFKFTHKRQMGRINSALNYLIQYAQDGSSLSDGRMQIEKENKSSVEDREFSAANGRKYKRDDKEGFYQWMLNDQHMAEASCRGYVSAIRGAEKYAEEHSLESVSFFEVTAEEARKTADALFGDAEFIEKNEVQHNRFRAAITKLLAYLGEDWTVPDKSSSAKRTNTTPTKDDVQVDVKPYEAVLIQNFPRGYRLGSSIELKKFRRYFEEMNGYALEQESDEVGKIISLCGIEHEGRVYAPETMLSEELRGRLFDFVDKNFEEGKTVVYYEALFREFSEDFLDQNIYDVQDFDRRG